MTAVETVQSAEIQTIQVRITHRDNPELLLDTLRQHGIFNGAKIPSITPVDKGRVELGILSMNPRGGDFRLKEAEKMLVDNEFQPAKAGHGLIWAINRPNEAMRIIAPGTKFSMGKYKKYKAVFCVGHGELCWPSRSARFNPQVFQVLGVKSL